MLKDLKFENIYIVCGHTDMRKSIDGLASIIQQQFQLDLTAENLPECAGIFSIEKYSFS